MGLSCCGGNSGSVKTSAKAAEAVMKMRAVEPRTSGSPDAARSLPQQQAPQATEKKQIKEEVAIKAAEPVVTPQKEQPAVEAVSPEEDSGEIVSSAADVAKNKEAIEEILSSISILKAFITNFAKVLENKVQTTLAQQLDAIENSFGKLREEENYTSLKKVIYITERIKAIAKNPQRYCAPYVSSAPGVINIKETDENVNEINICALSYLVSCIDDLRKILEQAGCNKQITDGLLTTITAIPGNIQGMLTFSSIRTIQDDNTATGKARKARAKIEDVKTAVADAATSASNAVTQARNTIRSGVTDAFNNLGERATNAKSFLKKVMFATPEEGVAEQAADAKNNNDNTSSVRQSSADVVTIDALDTTRSSKRRLEGACKLMFQLIDEYDKKIAILNAYLEHETVKTFLPNQASSPTAGSVVNDDGFSPDLLGATALVYYKREKTNTLNSMALNAKAALKRKGITLDINDIAKSLEATSPKAAAAKAPAPV
jgi:hypothetical protein